MRKGGLPITATQTVSKRSESGKITFGDPGLNYEKGGTEGQGHN
jgi:hypothetical protein